MHRYIQISTEAANALFVGNNRGSVDCDKLKMSEAFEIGDGVFIGRLGYDYYLIVDFDSKD